MEPKLLETVGKIAGIGGLALGVFLLLFREVIRRNIFPMLSQDKAYRLIQQFMFLTFGVAALGIFAWVYVSTSHGQGSGGTAVSDDKDRTIAGNLTVSGTVVDSETNGTIGQAQIAVSGASKPAVSDDNGNFHIDLGSAGGSKDLPVHLRVSKTDYQTLDWQVTPPVDQVVVPLTHSR
jgi:hypothetical protein